jgi:hypothetical protein
MHVHCRFLFYKKRLGLALGILNGTAGGHGVGSDWQRLIRSTLNICIYRLEGLTLL